MLVLLQVGALFAAKHYIHIYILFVTIANLWPPRSLRIYIYIYTRIHIYTHISISIRFVLLHIAGMHTARLRAWLLSRILFGKCWPCRRCRQAASRGCQAASKISKYVTVLKAFPDPWGRQEFKNTHLLKRGRSPGPAQ